MFGHLRALSKSSGKRYRAGSGSCSYRLIWAILTPADRDYNVGAHLRPSKEEKGSDVSGTTAVIPQGRYDQTRKAISPIGKKSLHHISASVTNEIATLQETVRAAVKNYA